MKKIILFFSALVLTGAVLQAQNGWRQKNMMLLDWEIGVPLNTKYLKEASLRGGNFTYRHFLNEKFSIGGGLSWNSFEEYIPSTLYEKPDGSSAFYTDMVRQVYTLPMYLQGHYYLDAGKAVKPYLGLGLGAQYSEQSAYYNIFVTEVDNWGFLVRPEVGALIKMGDHSGFNLSAAYNYATNENEDFKIESLSHIAFSVGIWWNLY